MTDVLRVLPQVAPGHGGDRLTGVSEQLVRLFVHTHHRDQPVVGPVIDLQDVFHAGDELAVRVRRDRPALLQMRTKPPFFRARPIVE